MTNSINTGAKYRPVLKRAQLAKIVASLKADPEPDVDTYSSLAYLVPFIAKIDMKGMKAIYNMAPEKPSLLESLGAGAGTGSAMLQQSNADRERYWEECYNKYITDPSNCTHRQLDAAQEHMYINELMTEQQLQLFESGAMCIHNSTSSVDYDPIGGLGL